MKIQLIIYLGTAFRGLNINIPVEYHHLYHVGTTSIRLSDMESKEENSH